MFALLYFLMIMPQQKKQKELQKMLDNIKVNDKVITTSGIYGRVVTIKPDKNSVVIEIDETNHVRVEFQRGHSRLSPGKTAPPNLMSRSPKLWISTFMATTFCA